MNNENQVTEESAQKPTNKFIVPLLIALLGVLIASGAWLFQQNKITDLSNQKTQLDAKVADLEKQLEESETTPEPKQETTQAPSDEVLIKSAGTNWCSGADFINCQPSIMSQKGSRAEVKVTDSVNSKGIRYILVKKQIDLTWSVVFASQDRVCQTGNNSPDRIEFCK